MKKLLTRLSKSRFPYDPLITVEISKKRLLHNLVQFRKLAPQGQVAPVLKSNAYGHGLLEIAHILDDENRAKSSPHYNSIPFFVVDSYFEAVALRARGVHTPLLIIGYTRPETILRARLKNVSFTITDIETLRALSVAPTPRFFQKKILVHIKIDTGMHRQGILPDELSEGISLLKKSTHLTLEGICSHLSDADNADRMHTSIQINSWNTIVHLFKKEFTSIKYIHLAATDGHALKDHIEANVSRLGIGLYGLTETATLTSTLDIQPVLEMKTIITGVKKLHTGQTIGYGNTFTVPHNMTVATIPVGYFEGLDRRLSNKGTVFVGKNRIACPIVGRVSMNITSIDVSSVAASIGDEVTVISHDAKDPNSIRSMVSLSGDTIPYERIVKIPAHLRRVVIDEAI